MLIPLADIGMLIPLTAAEALRATCPLDIRHNLAPRLAAGVLVTHMNPAAKHPPCILVHYTGALHWRISHTPHLLQATYPACRPGAHRAAIYIILTKLASHAPHAAAAGHLFFNDFSQYAAQERMESWDNKFSLLKSLPHVSSRNATNMTNC